MWKLFKKGLENLERHLDNTKHFGLKAVVAINKFTTDTDEEIALIQEASQAKGIQAVISDVWGQGGAGAEDLAKAVKTVVDSGESNFKGLYDWSWGVEKKIKTIAQKIYGADSVEYTSKAKMNLRRIKRLGLEHLPVCIAKTQKSFSDNPSLLGAPSGFTITVREIEIAAGAGFLVPITGDIMRMPGLPSIPSAEHIDIDKDGKITGLF